ncbi:MAG: divergent polysaccharide deacetylase family protein [Alphaproteobacteria bacterium]|nr:divergent polysaccharide deacetylase family protein [Alphaproteobacteria bacterium]
MREDNSSASDHGTAGSLWARLSPLYKKRLLQGVLAWLLLTGVVGLWLFLRAETTVQAWNARIPQAIIALESDIAAVPPLNGDTDAPADTSVNGMDDPVAVALPAGKTARIAIILSDAGLSEAPTLRAMQVLPPQVAFAFSPYSPRLKPWLEQAAAAGRETFMLLPMEPLTYPKDDPGPRALLSRKSENENHANLQWLLSHGTTTGVMNFMGSRFMADRRNMLPAFDQIKRRGLIFVENPSMAGLQSAASFAEEAGVPYLSAEVQIDQQADETALRRQLFLLEKAAGEKGFAIGVAAPYPVTLDVLPKWAESLAARGFTLTAPSALLKNGAPKTRTP